MFNQMNIPEEKAPSPKPLIGGRKLSSMLKLYFEVSHLRNIYRRGWLIRGLPPEICESDADHVFMYAFFGMVLVEHHYPHLDAFRVVKMILIHEIPEVIDGDKTPNEIDSHIDRHTREKYAILDVFKEIPNGHEYIDLWLEFEAGETEEAKFAKQLDKLEPMLLSVIYQLQNPDLDFSEFLANAEEKISDPVLLDLVRECRELIAK